MPNLLYDAFVSGRRTGDGVLFTTVDGTSVTDAEFFDLAARLAGVLIDNAVEPGERVAVQVPKSIEALALYVACVQVGAVFLPLNTAYTDVELAYFINDAEPRLLVIDSARSSSSLELAAGTTLMTLGSDQSGSLIDAAAQADALSGAIDRSADDLAAILYTSGTTGRSKGAMLTQANLLSNAQTLVSYWQFTPADTLLHALPIFHTHGLFVACNIMFLCGGHMIFQPGFSVDSVLHAVPRSSVLMGVPTFYTRLLSDPRFTRESVQHMRLFISGSAPLLADTHRAFEQRTGKRILERYGMTETNMNTSNPFHGERIAGTVGQALPGVELRICYPGTQQNVEAGKIGVLQVRGPNVFAGYWGMPEKTQEELLPDGFFITGDLATIDEKGYVTIVGRSKDLIISGGYNIYPKEIELALDELPGVRESAVIGVPHADFGEAVVAAIVRENPKDPDELDETSVIKQLGGKLARFKQPKRVKFIDELPRNAMGKVQKNVLRERWAGLFDQ